MITPLHELARSPECADVLTEILHAGRARPGLTLVAAFFDACQPGGTPTCCNAPPGYEVVTIVCRDGGGLEPSPAEEQFATAWRLAGPRLCAQSDVFVVTPEGWSCLRGGSGEWPILEITPDRGLPDDDVLELPPLVDPEALASDPSVGFDLADDIPEPVGEQEDMVIHYDWPWPAHVAPACAGVARGSLTPCSVWQVLPRVEW